MSIPGKEFYITAEQGIYSVTNFMELEDVDLAAQLNGGESHILAQKPGVETRLEILNLRGKLGGKGNTKVY